MTYTDLHYGTVSRDEVQISEKEASARLGYPYDPQDADLRRCLDKVLSAADFRYAWRPCPVSASGDVCDLGMGQWNSHSLARNLAGCESGIILSVTAGAGIDRLWERERLVNVRDAFLCDALASAAIEAVCDIAQALAVRERAHRPRFSPGYGDLSLAVQPAVLDWLQASVTLGIHLDGSLFMHPMKSITAIIGVLP